MPESPHHHFLLQYRETLVDFKKEKVLYKTEMMHIVLHPSVMTGEMASLYERDWQGV